MGIQVEFNPDLALRPYSAFTKKQRRREECVPKNIKAGRLYKFLKKGQRNYWLLGEIPLLETDGNQILSRPKASIRITDACHKLINRELWTVGHYQVISVFAEDDARIHFESYTRRKY